MQRVGNLAAAAYLIAAILIIFPFFDVFAAAWPVRAGQVNWRYGTVGLFSRVLVTPMLGMLLACLTALLLEQLRVLRVLAVLNGVAALLVIGVIGLFMLDAVQLRAQAAEEVRGGLNAASVIAIAKYSLALLGELALGIGAWKAARGHGRTRTAGKAAGSKAPILTKRPGGSVVPERTTAAPSAPSRG